MYRPTVDSRGLRLREGQASVMMSKIFNIDPDINNEEEEYVRPTVDSKGLLLREGQGSVVESKTL